MPPIPKRGIPTAPPTPWTHLPPSARDSLRTFLTTHTTYELLPPSYKVLSFSTTLPIVKALGALVQHGVQSAPIWDVVEGRFAGMLTVTDLLNLLLRFWRDGTGFDEAVKELETLTIAGLKGPNSKIVSADPMVSLLEASQILLDNRLHRLPLVHKFEQDPTEMIVSVITQFKILKYIANNYPDLSTLQTRVSSIGIFDTIQTITPHTPLHQVLKLFNQHHISCLPIILNNNTNNNEEQENKDRIVIDVYEKYDILNLAKDASWIYKNLNLPVSEAILYRAPEFEGIHLCELNDTVEGLLRVIQSKTVHRFVVVEKVAPKGKEGEGEGWKLVGLVTLSDILRFLVMAAVDDGKPGEWASEDEEEEKREIMDTSGFASPTL